jgi:hypothetical protein
MSCQHTPAYPELSACPSKNAAAAACTIVDSHDALTRQPRAVTIPDGQRTLISRAFWNACGPMQRAAVVSHERAHVVIGLDVPCESCADKVGGYLMSSWGFTPEAIEAGYSSLRVPRERNIDGSYRDAARGAVEGARMATRRTAARGLQGSDFTDEQLLAARASGALTTDALLAVRRQADTAIESPSERRARLASAALPASSIPTPPPTGAAADVTAVAATTAPQTAAPSGTAAAVLPAVASKEPLFSKDVQTQVIAGVIVAVILAFVLGRA